MRGGPGKYITILFCFLSQVSYSQEITVKGGFLQDSLVIGQEINYWISATYPPSLELIFPDSNSVFGSFEYADKVFLPTELRGTLAFDSTVYTLQSFEIDKVQYLQLEAILLSAEDSSRISSPKDSIFLTELAPVVTDTTKLRSNLDYLTVDRQFNYPLLYYVLGGIGIILLVVLAVFGRMILNFFKLRKLLKSYEQFSNQFSDLIRGLREVPSPENAEKALLLWKDYHQKLDKVPFKSLTTTELLQYEFTSELEKPLKSIDRVVYGRISQDDVFQDFQQLDDFSQHRYNHKYTQIKSSREEAIPVTKNEEEIIYKTKVTEFGLTAEQLNKELELGGKFVVFYYTVSIVVMTFQWSSAVKFVKNGERAYVKGLKYTLIAFLLGWWGIPFGLIYTPRNLYINMTGGKDITRQLLERS